MFDAGPSLTEHSDDPTLRTDQVPAAPRRHAARRRAAGAQSDPPEGLLDALPPYSVLVVGASLAGHSTARALRAEGFDGRITLVGAEPERPYDRPPLSKGFLAGTATEADLALEPAEENLQAEWVLGVPAAELDVAARTVTLADGRQLSAGAVVLATGSGAGRLHTVACSGQGGAGGLDGVLGVPRGGDLAGEVAALGDGRDVGAVVGEDVFEDVAGVVEVGFVGDDERGGWRLRPRVAPT